MFNDISTPATDRGNKTKLNKMAKTTRLFLYAAYIAAPAWMLFYFLTIRFTGSDADKLVMHVMYGLVSGSALMMSIYAGSIYIQRPNNRYLPLDK
jgi:hypothetical protein